MLVIAYKAKLPSKLLVGYKPQSLVYFSHHPQNQLLAVTQKEHLPFHHHGIPSITLIEHIVGAAKK